MRSTAGPAVPWTPDIKWKPMLHIQAASYQTHVRNLFPELESSLPYKRVYTLSPTERLGYANQLLPANAILATSYDNRQGGVFFDGPVIIPSLFEKYRNEPWPRDPWMSITPFEIFTLARSFPSSTRNPSSCSN